VTILEENTATLPLRLTGDGPWKVKFRRAENPERVFTAALTTPNDHLSVKEKGLYELLSVTDSQCPGSAIPDESTYEVEWVPRPTVQLASTTPATLDPYTGSYSLPPVCESLDDHVDLELSGLSALAS
jgi:nucleoporin POM152